MDSPKRSFPSESTSGLPSSLETKRLKLAGSPSDPASTADVADAGPVSEVEGATAHEAASAPGKIMEKQPIDSTAIGNLSQAGVDDDRMDVVQDTSIPSSNTSVPALVTQLESVTDTASSIETSRQEPVSTTLPNASQLPESQPQDDVPSEPEDAEEDLPALRARAAAYLAAQTQPIIIPSYSAWFNFATIAPIERRSIPEFFSNKNRSKTPQIYKDYRDFMINTYRLNPSEYLTVTACRRNLAGDVCAIMRVHAFLEQWGLINYQIDPDTKPSSLGPPFTGHFRVTLDTPKGLQPLHPGIKPNTSSPQPVASTSRPTTGSLNLDLRKQVYQTTSKGLHRSITPTEGSTLASKNAGLNGSSVGGQQKAYSCDTCGVDCTRVRYHSLKDAKYSVCPACYLSGRFPSTMFSGDFVRIDDAAFKHASTDDWTDQELLLLLEAIEMHDEDWTSISDHVQTRTRDQCILKFLQLPIEDPYLAAASAETDLGPLKYAVGLGGNAEALPFAKADNPVMSVVAFLASTIGPGVAAAAAGRAMGELTGDLKQIAKKPEEGDSRADVSENKDESEKEKEGEQKENVDEEDKDKPREVVEGDVSMQDDEAVVGSPSKEIKEEKEDGQTTTDQSDPVSVAPAPSRSALQQAASVSLSAAASKASVLASEEERQLQSLVSRLVAAQLKKLELKMAHFEQLEEMVEHERRAVEVARQNVYRERIKVLEQTAKVKAMMEQAQGAIRAVEGQIGNERAASVNPAVRLAVNSPSFSAPPPAPAPASTFSNAFTSAPVSTPSTSVVQPSLPPTSSSLAPAGPSPGLLPSGSPSTVPSAQPPATEQSLPTTATTIIPSTVPTLTAPTTNAPVGSANPAMVFSADIQAGLDQLKQATDKSTGPVVGEADVSMEPSLSTDESAALLPL
ncbi:swi snf complex protein [Phaffia rhodozyma]|uniref:Swi snf complex protein n=1 Tax=Phaffia rhodozyma TaxID=264483 RepID=A0A0F7STE5_PHARH|nr:swi snf complex protein [Phaffia rhodozyma]